MQNKNNKHTLLSIQDIEMNTYYLLMNNDKQQLNFAHCASSVQMIVGRPRNQLIDVLNGQYIPCNEKLV
jgi:hypothetical protein